MNEQPPAVWLRFLWWLSFARPVESIRPGYEQQRTNRDRVGDVGDSTTISNPTLKKIETMVADGAFRGVVARLSAVARAATDGRDAATLREAVGLAEAVRDLASGEPVEEAARFLETFAPVFAGSGSWASPPPVPRGQAPAAWPGDKHLDRARQHLAEGNQRKAINELWRAEAVARTDATEAAGLLQLASALRDQTRGRRRQDCDLLVGYATTYLSRAAGQPLAPVEIPPKLPRAHTRRFSAAWWLKLVGVAPLGIIALRPIANAASGNAALPAVLIGLLLAFALAYVSWRKPGCLGCLVLVLAPLVALVAAYAYGNTGLLAGGLMLIWALVLAVASRWRTRTSDL